MSAIKLARLGRSRFSPSEAVVNFPRADTCFGPGRRHVGEEKGGLGLGANSGSRCRLTSQMGGIFFLPSRVSARAES